MNLGGARMKIVISDKKTGKSIQKELSSDEAQALYGKKIGDTFSGELIGIEGYEFLITGGTDNAGFPMRKDIDGTGRRKIFATRSVGIRKVEKGQRIRKTVAGNTIYAGIAQVNVVITKYGNQDLFKHDDQGQGSDKEAKKQDKQEEQKENVKVKEKQNS